ncbi:HAMP domain-containing sensor histidine kinase [Caldilinea sp.]|jgi:two-component system OmpR family sensor kinase|uniref:sensor histidine kinase n=1 Tax=Caldilinea sp. TaxID=2293560 RepID=UPI001B23AC23|nr:HAMP domain-containing sensor histidine kinase [Caldilinea sp.]MBO9392822.1 HAMP domain-containing histidine kinase [Caldilinea sp.]
MNRLFDTLQKRLLLTHMLVAFAVLLLASSILLALQAPLRSEALFRRMGEWLPPTVTLARSNFASLLLTRDSEAETRFFAYLRSQAAAQDTRILLVVAPEGAVLFDSEDRLQGQNWQPTDVSAFEPPRRMRRGMMDAFGEITRGMASLEGTEWIYVSTLLWPLQGGHLNLVMLKPAPTPVRAVMESITELPRGLLMGSLLTLVAAIFLLSRWTASAVTRSLAPLMAGTRALAEGNLNYRVDVSSVSLAEVHALADSFNQMADRVQQSQQAQRDFVANVSHDLKTPLTSILGYSQALLDGAASTPAAQQRAALIIHQEAQRLGHLVEEIIDLARLESGQLHLHLQSVDPNEIGEEILESFRPQAEAAQISLEWKPLASCPPIPADAARLRRALANLLDNAIKHTPAGERVLLAVEYLEGPRQVQFSVRDKGPGIPEAERERIWERFYRLDRARTAGGSGLGLAIVKEIVEAHGGTVGIENLGDGSRFWIRLPCSEKAPLSKGGKEQRT